MRGEGVVGSRTIAVFFNGNSVMHPFVYVGLQVLTIQQGIREIDQTCTLRNGFSGFVSDKIALDRAVKDIRHPL